MKKSREYPIGIDSMGLVPAGRNIAVGNEVMEAIDAFHLRRIVIPDSVAKHFRIMAIEIDGVREDIFGEDGISAMTFGELATGTPLKRSGRRFVLWVRNTDTEAHRFMTALIGKADPKYCILIHKEGYSCMREQNHFGPCNLISDPFRGRDSEGPVEETEPV